MKKTLLIICLLHFSCSLFSQDVFLLTNGLEINAKLLTIDKTNVNYSENGANKSIIKSEVFRIVLASGEKIVVKQETIYPPPSYEDEIIFTDGSDKKVKIISIINGVVKYLSNGVEYSDNPSSIKFIKYKDGTIIKGSDLIKYEDKIILVNGEEILNVKYLRLEDTKFRYQEKGKSGESEIEQSEVFVIKLANGEKIFPPSNISKTASERKDTVAYTKTTPETKPTETKTENIQQKSDKMRLKNGTLIKCNFIKFEDSLAIYETLDGEKKTEKIVLIDYILDEMENLIVMPVIQKKPIEEKRKSNFNIALGSLNTYGIFISSELAKSNVKSVLAAIGNSSIKFGYRYNKRFEQEIEPAYSRAVTAFSSTKTTESILARKDQVGLILNNRLYLTKRFGLSFGIGVFRDITVFTRYKASSTKDWESWKKEDRADLSQRFHLNEIFGFGWKGRRATFDFIIHNLDQKGTKDVLQANSVTFGFRFDILLFNSNKQMFK